MFARAGGAGTCGRDVAVLASVNGASAEVVLIAVLLGTVGERLLLAQIFFLMISLQSSPSAIAPTHLGGPSLAGFGLWVRNESQVDRGRLLSLLPGFFGAHGCRVGLRAFLPVRLDVI